MRADTRCTIECGRMLVTMHEPSHSCLIAACCCCCCRADPKWLESEVELLRLAGVRMNGNWDRISHLFADKTPEQCKTKFDEIKSDAPRTLLHTARRAECA